ncbi:hypothetical protein B9Z55_007095 [Caenorhabditis nigoni]|uniref:Homeobox domain-containing protein n=1 Tax=Caenorhabditis nigoni TaxID=1611254 RepID=A0A2G5V858_9PELO|nr:hypothetical protein B9Z55_007095 [Caenorhabditis nigoni]
MSSDNVLSTSLAKRTRKAPAPGASKGPNPKRRTLVDSSESEPEVDLRESRPRRKSAKYAIHHESDSELDDSPMKRKSGNIRRTEDSKEDESSSSSSSSLESDSDASIFEYETEDEQPMEPSQPSSSKRERRRKRTDKKRGTKVTFTAERNQVLLAAFNQNPYPSLDQRNKLADETKLTEIQINSWFARKRKRSENLLKKRIFFTEQQKAKLNEAFAASRIPEESVISSLVSDLQLSRTQVTAYFRMRRFKNPPKTLPREEAEPILLEFIRENPKCRGFKSEELSERTGWRRDEIKNFFEKYRRENGAAAPLRTKKTSKYGPLPEEEAHPILLEVFAQNPDFTDYNNTELTQKIRWPYRRIMGWLRMKRKNTLESFFKKEISVLPEEMANFERLYQKYEAYADEDKVYQIGMKEDVFCRDVADYFIERQRVLDELQGGTRDGNVEEEEEDELANDRDAHEEDQNDPELDYEVDKEVESTDEEMHDQFEDRGGEEDNEEVRGQVDQEVTIGEDLPSKSNCEMGEEGQGVQAVVNQEATELEMDNPHENPVVEVEEDQIEPELDYHVDYVEPVARQEAVEFDHPPIDEDLHGQMEGPVEQMETSTDLCNPSSSHRLRKPDNEGQSSSAMNQDMSNQAMHPSRDGSKIVLWSVNTNNLCSSNQSNVNSNPRQQNYRSQRDYYQEQILGKLFEKQQFLGREKKELCRRTGCREKFLSQWFRKNRMAVLRSFFKKEVPALPEEMANFERIFNSYEFENYVLADVIFRIETTENIYGDDFASYLCERKMITEELKQRVGDQLEENEEGQVEEGSVDQREQNGQVEFDHPQEAHLIGPEDETREEEDVQPVVSQEAVEPETENGQIEFENQQLASIHGEEHDFQPVVPQEAVQMEFENDGIEFDNPRNAPLIEERHSQQVEGPVADQQIPGDVKRETPEIDVKNVERLRTPVKQEMWEAIENVEEDEEEEVEQLIVFDVIDRNTPQEIESLGPVTILRVQTSFEDLQPYLEDLVGIPEIGYARKSEIVENKRRLNADWESLTLPFNCSLNYLGWSEVQVKEFFCQILPPETIRKLVEKVSAGCWLYMFQETEKSYFKRLNKRGLIIDWNQFLTICQEIKKIERFES